MFRPVGVLGSGWRKVGETLLLGFSWAAACLVVSLSVAILHVDVESLTRQRQTQQFEMDRYGQMLWILQWSQSRLGRSWSQWSKMIQDDQSPITLKIDVE